MVTVTRIQKNTNTQEHNRRSSAVPRPECPLHYVAFVGYPSNCKSDCCSQCLLFGITEITWQPQMVVLPSFCSNSYNLYTKFSTQTVFLLIQQCRCLKKNLDFLGLRGSVQCSGQRYRLTASAWVLSGFSRFLPQSNNMHVIAMDTLY